MRLVAVLLAVLVLLPRVGASSGYWEDNFELHGRVSSRAYLRSPGLNLSQEAKLSSWRNEVWLETFLRLRETSDARVELTTVLRPVYEAVYDLYGDTWGERTTGGERGTGSSESQYLALRGRRFSGRGEGVRGEMFLGNQDTLFPLTGRFLPGIAINPLLVASSGMAPWAAHGSRQPHVGGSASGSTFLGAARGFDLDGDGSIDLRPPGADQLERSLRLGAQSPNAPAGLLTPLNRYAGSLGDRDSLDQFPAGMNRTEDQLKFNCFDGGNSTCWIRELFLDVEYGDTFVRAGRQIIAWGKADVFQLQDVINPLDEGLHNVFPSLDERRIPQWSLQVIQTLGEAGPFEDITAEFVWIVDRFTPRQIGQCGEPYAFMIGCQARQNASAHEFLDLSLAEVEERHWTLQNTEPGARLEFSLPAASMTFSLSAFWGFQDTPVLEAKNLYSVDNPNPAAMLAQQAAGAGSLIDPLFYLCGQPGSPDVPKPQDLAHPWLCGFDPYAKAPGGQPLGTLRTANQQLLRAWQTRVVPLIDDLGWGGADRAIEELTGFESPLGSLVLPWSGSEFVAKYPRVLTLGGSMDWDVPGLDSILRVEAAYEVDRGLTNTAKPTLEDDSDVFKLLLGIDRPVLIPFLGTSQPTFISAQTFWEHVMDYDDGLGSKDGMIRPRDTWISTLFVETRWARDEFGLSILAVSDWTHRAWAFGPTLRWSPRADLYFDVGLHLIGGRKREHGFIDVCGDGTDRCVADPTTWTPGQTQTSNAGLVRASEAPFFPESFADRYMQERDEVWVGVTWAF